MTFLIISAGRLNCNKIFGTFSKMLDSTNKTSLGLNMWEASDKPVRQDFVNDNNIIDGQITKLNRDFFEVGTLLENTFMQTIDFPQGLSRPPLLVAAQINLFEGIWVNLAEISGFTGFACSNYQLAINKDAPENYVGYGVRFLFKK